MSTLFEGSFNAPIMGHTTLITFEIESNYEVRARFCNRGTPYEFYIKRWSKTGSFKQFAILFNERFGDRIDEFGSVTVETLPDGGVKTTELHTPQQIINMLKYATVNVFECAEQIIAQKRRCILDYATAHRELGKQTTYEEYIHLVACHCIVRANFHVPGIQFPMVDFCDDVQRFNAKVLAGIVAVDEYED
jgi:hypothetical protein